MAPPVIPPNTSVNSTRKMIGLNDETVITNGSRVVFVGNCRSKVIHRP